MAYKDKNKWQVCENSEGEEKNKKNHNEYGLNIKSRKSHKNKILQELKKKDNSQGLENVKKTFPVELGLAIKYVV